jgi:hypothetical protein
MDAFAVADQNNLTLHITKLTLYMMKFGFFNFRFFPSIFLWQRLKKAFWSLSYVIDCCRELMELSQRMLRILDDALGAERPSAADEVVVEIQIQVKCKYSHLRCVQRQHDLNKWYLKAKISLFSSSFSHAPLPVLSSPIFLHSQPDA